MTLAACESGGSADTGDTGDSDSAADACGGNWNEFNWNESSWC